MSKSYVGSISSTIKIGTRNVLKAYKGSDTIYNPISVPDSPTNVVATLSGKDASISFSIPTNDGGSSITNYLVQYSSNNGSSWTSYTETHPTKLLLRMNGANNSNTFTDSSNFNKTVSRTGNPVISTSQSKFDGSSAYFNGSSYISLASSEDFNFGTGDFTIECWVYLLSHGYPETNTGYNHYFSIINQNTFAFKSYSGYYYFYSNSAPGVQTSAAPVLNSWQHLALVRSGTSLRIYVNGELAGSSTISASASYGANGPAFIGSGWSGEFLHGYMDEFRLTKGVARYSSNFTPSRLSDVSDDIFVPTSPITVNTLSYNKSYIFRVVAVNNIGNSIPSNSSNGVTTPPGVPGYLYGQFRRGGRPNDSEMLSGNILSTPLSSPSLYSSINYGENDDEYGFIAIGYFIPPTNGTYTFYTSSDDGSAVWVGSIAEASTGRSSSNMVVNNNVTGYQGDTERSGSIVLTAGTVYAIRIIHREGDGGDNLRFSWAGPGISKRESLASYFYANNFGSEPPTIISSTTESLNAQVDLYLVSSPAPTYYTISYSTNGLDYTVFGNGQTAPATPISITGLTNNTTYSFKIVATNNLGSSDELLITNLTPSSSNIRPLSLGQAFLSNIYSDTIIDSEYDNLRLGQAFLSNIYSDTVLENEYDNLRLGQAFLSNIYIDNILESEYDNLRLGQAFLSNIYSDPI